MDTLVATRLFGVLVTTAVVLTLLGRELRNAEWRSRFRDVMTETGPPRDRRTLVTRYLDHVLRYTRILDKPYTVRTIAVHVTLLFGCLFSLTLLLRYTLVLGIPLSLGLALLLYERHFARLARKRKEDMVHAFLRQGVERGVHVLVATGRLDDAFSRMADSVHDAPLQRRLRELCELGKTPQFATPEDAFVHWAGDLGIDDISHFALATREARRYNVPLDELWLDMAEIQGKELEYRRRIRAETAHQRTGGVWFYGMLAGAFLVAYPFAAPHMSDLTRFLFWTTLAVMTLGLYLVFSRSQVIDA